MNAIANNGDTPLHIAMKSCDEDTCLILTKLLAGAGCTPSGLDADDKPPIQVAVTRGFVSVAEYLLSQDVRLPLRILFAALQAPVVKRVEMIRLLISKGANVHALHPDGDTLLHVSMRSPDRSVCLEIAKRLVDAGCNPLAHDIRGETPLDIAAKQQHHEVVNYLMPFSSSLDVLSLLQDPAKQASIWCSLICNINSLCFQPEENKKVLQVVEQFTCDEDKCLEMAKTFTGDAGSLCACRFGSTRLFDVAVSRGFSKVVEFLCSQVVPLPPAFLFTALRYRVSMVPSLIRKGADVHVWEENGDTLIHVAVSILEETQCCETTRVLVEAGCDPFALNNANKQPIHIAAARGFISVVELLFHYSNTSASFPPDLLFTAFHVLKEYSMPRLLLNHRAILSSTSPHKDHHIAPNSANEQAIHIAVAHGFVSIAEYLLLHCFDASTSFPPDLLFTALHSPKRYSMVRLLVNHGANVSYIAPNGDHLLHVLLRSAGEEDECLETTPMLILGTQCCETTRVLAEAGCDPFAFNNANEQAIHIAVSRRFVSVAKYLLSHYFNTSTSLPPDLLFTALRMYDKKYSMVRLLVNHGANMSYTAPNGDHLLHVLLRSAGEEDECLEITKILCEAGCSLLSPNGFRETPLHIAVSQGFTSVVDYLHSRNVPLPSDILFSTLRARRLIREHASMWMSMIASLVRKGADIHARNKIGNTVLHSAMWMLKTESQCLEVTKFLIEAGCDPHARNAMERTLLELATTMGHSKVAEYLRRHSSESAPLLKRTVSPVDDGVRRVKPRLLSSEPDDSGHDSSLTGSSSPSTNV